MAPDDDDPLVHALRRLGIGVESLTDAQADEIRGLRDEVDKLRMRTLREKLDSSGSHVRIRDLEKILNDLPHAPTCPCFGCEHPCVEEGLCNCFKSRVSSRRRR